MFFVSPRVREVCTFFLVFRIALGAKSPEIFFQKTPRYRGKRPGASFFVFFHLQNRTALGGVTRSITVVSVTVVSATSQVAISHRVHRCKPALRDRQATRGRREEEEGLTPMAWGCHIDVE